MKYTVCESGGKMEIYELQIYETGDMARHEARKKAEDLYNLGKIQRCTGRKTGEIYGICTELDDNDQETAILYMHRITGAIWIDLN